jgi:2-phosphosulfolactate phosphatase
MRITTFAEPHSIVDDGDTIRNRFVIVVDTLRATSVIAAALAAGADAVIPVAEVEEAMNLYRNLGADIALLCGERGGNPIPGFHLGNSPAEYNTTAVRGKKLVMTTTNGTRAILSASGAAVVALGAMVNAGAVAAAAMGSGMDVTFVCAGTKGRFSLEDVLTAGAIFCAMGASGHRADDLSLLALSCYRHNADDLPGALRDCTHARFLIDSGYSGDVEYCMGMDRLNAVPYYKNGMVQL